ncbi:MAG: NAD(+) synthase [Hahellaceae bacterium]|nr:NAD(+) synthase [Hahellaceae bacterium]
MRIALAQINVIPGDLARNFQTLLACVEQARASQVDIIAFPELCLSGYLLSDLWLDRRFCAEVMRFNDKVREASQGIAIVFGSIFVDEGFQSRLGDGKPHPNKDGRTRLYNAVIAVQNGEYVERLRETPLLPKGIQPKTLLPNYRFFDDERYFYSLPDIARDFDVELESLAQPFRFYTASGDLLIGLEVCEDLWCQDYRLAGEPLNITRLLVSNGAEKIINVSASPWTFLKHDARDRRVQFLADDLKEAFVPFYYVNNVGAQNNGKNIVTFDGGTTVYNRLGKPCLTSEHFFEPDLIIVDDSQLTDVPVVRHEMSRINQKFHAIVTGLRYLREMLGWKEHPAFVIGLSGGIDSAVVACLLVAALGKNKVWGVNMPTRYNSAATKGAARQVADALGIEFSEIPIEGLVSAHQAVFSTMDENRASSNRGLSDENIQAKIRGTSILSNLAGRYGRMFTNNGNKLEVALGYATLYGDVGGVIAPIADLTKTEVYDLGRFMNEVIFAKTVIPTELFPDELYRYEGATIAPSAELRENQIDPIKFGYHCALIEQFTSFRKVQGEQVLTWYLEGTLEKNLSIPTSMIERWGLNDPATFVADLEWVERCIRGSVFKRIQAPPIIVTSPSAYGYDIRESQLPWRSTETFNALKEKVLALGRYSTQL